ncbi:unnamed protein product [Rotaria magnacalcarata]|uniref:Uncharacterized protein n=1 Tax=Rotaria magnacalcarata TaxID=392030 RepID=A0A816LUW5_9BILA|nr:unnamed protein product [Rotaria magnacalcarata]
MAMATIQSCCIKDCKIRPTMTCLGCSKLLYCGPHHKEHRDHLHVKLLKVADNCNQLLEEIKALINDPQKHPLMKNIDEWETQSIAKIRRVAQKNREELLPYVKNCIPQVEMKLASLITEVRQNPDDCGFMDTDIENWTKELERIKATLNSPPDFNIRLDSTEFLSKICLKVEDIPHIPSNATWIQNGVTVAGGNRQGSAINQLDHPFGLFVDDDETVVIADYWNLRITQWKDGNTTNGQVVAGGNGRGYRLNQLLYPTDVLIDKEMDNLIICYKGRVVKWSRYRGTTQGKILIDNILCYGLAMDNQRYLYVSDEENHAVRRYQAGDKNGTLVAGGNDRGVELNQLNSPRYLFVDRQQNVYVSDCNNHRVMKWPKGSKEGIVVAGGQGQGDALTQLNSPQGLFVDNLGTLYVSDSENHRVMRWTQAAKKGTVIVGGNGAGEEANQFNYPWGLSFDRHGNLYVADKENHRVQRFSIE